MKNYVAEMGGKFQGGATSITGYHRSMLQSSDAYTVVSEKVSPIQTAMKKMDQLYSYAAPYTAMLAPQVLFPLTYRHHEVSKKPVKFDNIKETDMYLENQLTDSETAAIQEYLRNIDVNDANKAYSVDNVSKPDYGPITFEDRRKVMGGNSKLAGSPDGLAGPAVAVTNFFTEDIATVISANASFGERMLAAAFVLPTPVRFMKPMDDVMGGEVGKGIDSTKQSSLVGREIELDWLGDNYKAIEIEGTVKVGGKDMDISRRVYQKNVINFDYTPEHPKAKGLSNRELAAKGRPPYVIDKNGKEVQIELHHLIQKESGNMVEIIATTHEDYKKILHGLIKNGDSFRNDKVLDKQFNNFRKKYWKWRSTNL